MKKAFSLHLYLLQRPSALTVVFYYYCNHVSNDAWGPLVPRGRTGGGNHFFILSGYLVTYAENQ